MTSKTQTQTVDPFGQDTDATVATPVVSEPSFRHALGELFAATVIDLGHALRGLGGSWRREPAGHAGTAAVTMVALAAVFVTQGWRPSAAPAQAATGPDAVARAAEQHAAAATILTTAIPDSSASLAESAGQMPADFTGLLPAVQQWAPQIQAAAESHGVPVRLFACLVQQESGGRPSVVSPAGAVGLAQIMPATGASLGLSAADLYDPERNLDGGARYLRQQFAAFGDWTLALRAYNSGPGAVQRGSFPAETRRYVAAISPCAGL